MSIEENVLQYVASRRTGNSERPLAPSAQSALQLSVVLGPDEGKTYRFEDDCTIGRASDATLRLADRGVAPLHARVRRAGDRFLLEDLGSREGTLLNGEPIEQSELEPGARIQVGPRSLLLFSIEDALQQSLMQAKKVEMIGRLSAGLNHEFNNLLCVLLANAAYLLELPGEMTLGHGDVRECLEDMRNAAQSGSELTNRLSMLAQTSNQTPQSVDLSGLCEETLVVLRGTFPKAIRIVGKVQPGIQVRGVRTHLRQMLFNPCLNARDAMAEGGTLTFELVLKGREEFDVPPVLRADTYAVISFVDSGRGVPPEVIDSAFEPFFTTKELELGKGLGLSTVRKIASDHGGTAELTSGPGAGTRLRIVLPVTSDADPSYVDPVEAELRAGMQRDSKTQSRPPALGSDRPSQQAQEPVRRRLLLAEEDEGLGRAFVRCLRREGYDVSWIVQPTEALRVFSAPDAAFDLVLLDMEPSDPFRRGLAAEFRKRNADVPILSFASDGRETDAWAQAGLDLVVRKPIDPAMLARIAALALRRVGKGPR